MRLLFLLFLTSILATAARAADATRNPIDVSACESKTYEAVVPNAVLEEKVGER